MRWPKFLPNPLYLFYRFSRRERWMVGGGSFVLAIVLGYFFILSPLLDQIRRFDRLIPRKEGELRELSELSAQYAALSSRVSKMESKIRPAEEFSIFSFVEDTAGKSQVRENIAYIRPLTPKSHGGLREVPVEVKVQNVSLSSLVGFVSSVEKAPALLRIRRLTVKSRFADPQYLDATFVVSSYKKGA